MGKPSKGARRGFSLIELLVVITIISIIISLFLPALGGIREQSRRVKCLAHCYGIGEAMTAYSGSHRDYFPVMPVPTGLPVAENQWRYGGVAGLFSLRQVGDGQSLGYGGATAAGLPYASGNTTPLLEPYLASFQTLVCPSDREDRYYGEPYNPQVLLLYASALPKTPISPAQQKDVVSYNLSYVYRAGVRAITASSHEPIWGDETNGPDVGDHAFYGYSQAPNNGTTPNSVAAGAAAAGHYAPVDNHKTHGGNMVRADGSGGWSERWFTMATPPREMRYYVD